MALDLTAINMKQIMQKINENDEELTRVIKIEKDARPQKQKTRKIPQSFKDDFKKTVMEMTVIHCRR